MSFLALAVLVGCAGGWNAEDGSSGSHNQAANRLAQPAENEVAVPQTLLSLVHAPEVHRELGLSAGQIADLERLFELIDGPWWRSRNLPAAELRPLIDELEGRVRQFVEAHWPAASVQRLKELELQSQGVRMLSRSDLSLQLSITADQQRKLVALAATTDRAEAEWNRALRQGRQNEQMAERLRHAKESEQNEGMKLLTSAQARQLASLVGPPFDFSKLTRIYPLAPPFQDTNGWIGDSPGTLRELRGKVVVVHFYAFQCINCQRNLPIYNEWVEQFAGRDVVVVGIQTPETMAERDPDKIAAAARENAQHYPILVDLENENWDAWGNTMWPTVYVIDRRGYIRAWWQGELKWQGAEGDQVIANWIERLLAEDE